MNKNTIGFFILLMASVCTYGQLNSSPTSEAGMFANARGGNPMLNLAMADLRAKGNKTEDEGETVGSPYLNEKFTLSKLYYDNEELGDFYIRYNALNSEIEIKESLETEEVKRLIADKKISIKYGTKALRFTTYINKKKETKNGYLSLINEGANYKLFHRLAIKYVEGKAAANSMVNAVPSRFAPFIEFYYQEEGVDRIDQLSQRKGGLLKQIKKEHKEVAKTYLKENSIDLDKEEDLITLFNYLNTL